MKTNKTKSDLTVSLCLCWERKLITLICTFDLQLNHLVIYLYSMSRCRVFRTPPRWGA